METFQTRSGLAVILAMLHRTIQLGVTAKRKQGRDAQYENRP